MEITNSNNREASELNEEAIAHDLGHRDKLIEPNHSGQTENNANYLFAGFWMRFWAYLIDLAVIWSLSKILLKPIILLFGLPNKSVLGFSAYEIGGAVVFYLYFILMVRFFRQTIGKMVFGLRVISLKGSSLSWGTIIFREFIGRFISKFILVGYLLSAFLPKKQGLHDIFADTSVIIEKRQ